MDKMFTFYAIIALFALILLSPFIVAFLLLYLGTAGFTSVGFSVSGALLVLLFMFVGSFFNIPLVKSNTVRVREPSFLGLFYRYVWRTQGISINVGGALIPLAIVAFLLLEIPLEPVIISTGVVAFVSFISSRFVPGVGVLSSAVLPVLFASLFALILSPEHAAETAFSSGVLGVLIGADLFRLPIALRKGAGVMSIGGAGVFDGIFIVGIVSAVLAGI